MADDISGGRRVARSAPGRAATALIAISGDTGITLRWDAVAGTTSYTVLRRTSSTSGTYATVATDVTDVTDTSYTDTDRTNGTNYFSYNGTSQAAPGVTGSINLLIQFFRQLHGATAVLWASKVKAGRFIRQTRPGQAPAPIIGTDGA